MYPLAQSQTGDPLQKGVSFLTLMLVGGAVLAGYFMYQRARA